METLPAKVLLVDDERVIADTLAIILRQAGYHCEVEYDSLSALEAAQRMRPQCIVMDISLPGMWGTDVAAAILTAQPECRCILYYGGSNFDTVFEGLKQGGFEFDTLTSPPNVEVLLELLREYKL
jgi:DNA-binding NtrC family response regulator